MNQLEERTIAMAGIVQACAQVQALARTGELNEVVADHSLKSILVLDALNTAAVYGGIQGVSSGLHLLRDGVLDSPQMENIELVRYAMSLVQLQRELLKHGRAYQDFGTEIEQLSAFSGKEFANACSNIYQKFISTLRPQIIVQGEQGFLQRRDVPPRVRALLLAGIRSAVLWQQKGGSRLKILWERRRYQRVAADLLKA